MKNSFSAMLDEGREILVGTILVIAVLIIIGAVASIPGAPPEAKAIAEQTSSSITLFWIFVIGLPSVGIIAGIIALVMWIRKETESTLM